MTDPAPHLLIVDDDERIRDLLRRFLIRNGFLVSVARDAGHARRVLAGLGFDLIVMDVMMPGESGVDLTRAIRATQDVPILLLTARGETNDRIEGLEAGADDYLPKPFEPKELLLRINAILRRLPDAAADEAGEDPADGAGALRCRARRAEPRGVPVRLTGTEVQLMRIFADNLRRVVSRARLVEDLGREDGHAQERAVDVQITRLRRKIEADPKQPRYLQTVRGEGYMLAPD